MSASTGGRSEVRRLQLRITAAAMVGVVLLLAVVSVGLVRLFRDELVDQIDEQLEANAQFVQQADEQGALPAEGTGDELAQFVAEDGSILYAPSSLEGEPPLLDPTAGPVQEPTTVTASSGDLRVLGLPLRGGLLVIGRSLDSVDDAVGSLITVLLVGVPLLALALGVLVWFVVGRSLRPVAAAMARERQLVADASHELRSPLAGVRALLETESEDLAALHRSRQDALATLARLDEITNDLLLLSVLEDGGPGTDPVDLDEAVLRQINISRASSEVVVDASKVSAGQVVGSSRELERAVDCLLSNAVRHARSRVEVGLAEEGGQVVLTVDDDGEGVPEADRAKIFERFTRLDEARARDDGGAGLGLAIVDAVVRAHRGSVVIADGALGGARFEVRLPASLHEAEHTTYV